MVGRVVHVVADDSSVPGISAVARMLSGKASIDDTRGNSTRGATGGRDFGRYNTGTLRLHIMEDVFM